MDEYGRHTGTFAIGDDGREADRTVPITEQDMPEPGDDGDDKPWEKPRDTSRTIRYRIWTHGRWNRVEYDYGLPRAVTKYLMAHEIPRSIAMHKHVASLAGPTLAVILGFPAAISLNMFAWVNGQATTTIVRLIWLPFIAVLAWYTVRAAAWHREWFVVTPERIILISGLSTRTVRPLPLKRTRDIELRKPRIGMILGYGTLYAQSLGTDRQLAEVRFIPDADVTFAAIWSFMLPSKDDDGPGSDGKG